MPLPPTNPIAMAAGPPKPSWEDSLFKWLEYLEIGLRYGQGIVSGMVEAHQEIVERRKASQRPMDQRIVQDVASYYSQPQLPPGPQQPGGSR